MPDNLQSIFEYYYDATNEVLILRTLNIFERHMDQICINSIKSINTLKNGKNRDRILILNNQDDYINLLFLVSCNKVKYHLHI